VLATSRSHRKGVGDHLRALQYLRRVCAVLVVERLQCMLNASGWNTRRHPVSLRMR